MFVVFFYIMMSLFVGFALLGFVAVLTKEPAVARNAFLASGVVFAIGLLCLAAASLL